MNNGLLQLVLVRIVAGAACMLAMTVASAQQLPDAATYKVQPGDIVNVSVWNETQLQRQVLVRPDGGFSFPLVGDISAVGQSPVDLQRAITEKLTKYIPSPVVTVSVEKIDGNKVYVIGQVKNPGAFVMNPRLDVMQVLALAGGATAYAQMNDIKIVRRRAGTQQILDFNFDDIAKGRSLDKNVLLESGDVIVVP